MAVVDIVGSSDTEFPATSSDPCSGYVELRFDAVVLYSQASLVHRSGVSLPLPQKASRRLVMGAGGRVWGPAWGFAPLAASGCPQVGPEAFLTLEGFAYAGFRGAEGNPDFSGRGAGGGPRPLSSTPASRFTLWATGCGCHSPPRVVHRMGVRVPLCQKPCRTLDIGGQRPGWVFGSRLKMPRRRADLTGGRAPGGLI